MEFDSESYRDPKYMALAINLARRIVFKEIDRKYKKIELRLHEPVKEGTTVQNIHAVWNPDFLDGVKTPEFMPRMKTTDLCQIGSFLLEISYISRITGGMGSYFQFDGYFLSVIVAADGRRMLDCRGEKAR
ncbi:MAG: hypothetical protein AAB263_00725 [Planctomycetota bacterium]